MRNEHSAVFEKTTTNSAIFIDYDNLHEAMCRRSQSESDVHEVLLELIEDLCRNTFEQGNGRAAAITAYADFSAFADGAQIQRLLSALGIDPRFVSNTWQANAAELQICVDAADAFYTRPVVESLVVISGDRRYMPLLQLARKHGRRAHLILLDPPSDSSQVPFLRDDVLDVSSLLSRNGHTLPHFAADGQADHSGNGHAPAPRSEADYHRVTDPLCLTALEIIEEYFGQYEEIYLTPLLRKLTETLEEEHCDPKTLISTLEEAGAVWLEKRRGFPHDYTVLLLDRNHPDMLDIIEEGRSYRSIDPDAFTSHSDGRSFD